MTTCPYGLLKSLQIDNTIIKHNVLIRIQIWIWLSKLPIICACHWPERKLDRARPPIWRQTGPTFWLGKKGKQIAKIRFINMANSCWVLGLIFFQVNSAHPEWRAGIMTWFTRDQENGFWARKAHWVNLVQVKRDNILCFSILFHLRTYANLP